MAASSDSGAAARADSTAGQGALDDLPFDTTYLNLPEALYARVDPTPVRDPRVTRVNRPLAERLGLDPDVLAGPDGGAVLSGNRVPAGAQPIAMAYAGHQFGNYVPQLGDGRAVLLGELVDRDGVRRDLHLKGIGRTPFSRMGDGRAHVGPVLREYLASEAMAGLGIPTSRALAMATTGERVVREDLYPGAVLARVATSHLRVGTFQYAHDHCDTDTLRALADYAIARHDPELKHAERPYQALLQAVATRTGRLIGDWMLVGFIHGVMNTDNVSIAGETIDYGPFAFMDTYHPSTVYSSIDMWGRYAYQQQPGIGQWNLYRFAETLLPLLDDDAERAQQAAYDALAAYVPAFEGRFHAGLRRKLGFAETAEGDLDLATELFDAMARQGADYTLTFRRLCDAAGADASADGPVRALFADPAPFDAWAERWRARLAEEGRPDAERRAAMRAVNPAYILRRHHVAQATAAAERGDYSVFEELLTLLSAPFDDHPGSEVYAQPPEPEEAGARTFCGT